MREVPNKPEKQNKKKKQQQQKQRPALLPGIKKKLTLFHEGRQKLLFRQFSYWPRCFPGYVAIFVKTGYMQRKRSLVVTLIYLSLHLIYLSLDLGNIESRKNIEQKFIFQIGTLRPCGINERFYSSNFPPTQHTVSFETISPNLSAFVVQVQIPVTLYYIFPQYVPFFGIISDARLLLYRKCVLVQYCIGFAMFENNVRAIS